MTLISTTDDHTGGRFEIATETPNGDIRTEFLDAPVNSVLLYDGHTNTGMIDTKLHKTYEGSFFLKGWRTFVGVNDTLEDPTGRGRERHVEVKRPSRATTEGSVRWVPSEYFNDGNVTLVASHSNVQLHL